MNPRIQHPARQVGRPGPLHDDLIETQHGVAVGAACCCPARPVVQVIMPRTAARPHEIDLLLCGHHYRVSREALAVARAKVSVLPGMTGSPATALLPDLPGPRKSIS
jgi:hypothetical protein